MNCPICSSPADETFQARHVPAAHCSSPACGHVWAVDAAPGQGVQQIDDFEAQRRMFGPRNRDLIGFLQRRGFLKAGIRLLDMGAGGGHFALSMREALPGLQIVAVEADPASLARLKSLGFEAYATLDEAPGAFDAISLIEVIEHVDHPVALLGALHARLSPGGQLYCTTPCGALRGGSRATNAYDTAEHIHFFTERSLALAFGKAGFSALRLQTVNAMTSRLTRPPVRWLKDLMRPVRALLRGHSHLTGFAKA